MLLSDVTGPANKHVATPNARDCHCAHNSSLCRNSCQLDPAGHAAHHLLALLRLKFNAALFASFAR
jgi:hypothetical protein